MILNEHHEHSQHVHETHWTFMSIIEYLWILIWFFLSKNIFSLLKNNFHEFQRVSLNFHEYHWKSLQLIFGHDTLKLSWVSIESHERSVESHECSMEYHERSLEYHACSVEYHVCSVEYHECSVEFHAHSLHVQCEYQWVSLTFIEHDWLSLKVFDFVCIKNSFFFETQTK